MEGSKKLLIVRLVILAVLIVILIVGLVKTIPPILSVGAEADRLWDEIEQYESESEEMAAELQSIEDAKVATYSAKSAGEEVANLQQTWAQRMQEMRAARVEPDESESSDDVYVAEIDAIQAKLAQYISKTDDAYRLWLDPANDSHVAWSFKTVWDFLSKTYRVTWLGVSNNIVCMIVRANYDADTNKFSDFEFFSTDYVPYATYHKEGVEPESKVPKDAFSNVFAFWSDREYEGEED